MVGAESTPAGRFRVNWRQLIHILRKNKLKITFKTIVVTIEKDHMHSVCIRSGTSPLCALLNVYREYVIVCIEYIYNVSVLF